MTPPPPPLADKTVADDGSGGADQAGKPAEVTTMLTAVGKLKGKLGDISSLQKFHRQREFSNRDTLESNCRRMAWFTVVECLVCVGFSLVQLFLVRSWFSTASRLPTRV